MEWTTARQLCTALRSGKVSAVEVMKEVYQRIELVNDEINALVALLGIEEALELAYQADQVPIDQRGPLHGLPMAPKDAVQVKGFATTWGFAPWADNIANKDDAHAARLRRAGAIFIGRSNMPEFGLGSNTFNSLYGKTRNPYDLSKTSGGSSGGAAAALASRILPLADGSDMGGSLRNPASFCNVVGFRPSIGRLPLSRGFSWLGRISTAGPMAVNVADAAWLFSVQAGPDHRDPLTLPEAGSSFFQPELFPEEPKNDLKGMRIAYAPELPDIPVDTEVQTVIQDSARVFGELGAHVVQDSPDLSGAMEVFQAQRAAGLSTLANTLEETLPSWRQSAKETAVWNLEKGQQLPSAELFESELKRSQIYARVADFFQTYDALLLPAAQVLPFDGDQEWIEEINGRKMPSYIDWMAVCCVISITSLPAISVPAGFSKSGLPIGLQIVGKPRGDLELLSLAHRFEQTTKVHERLPEVCSVS